jgi:hypothetical protein
MMGRPQTRPRVPGRAARRGWGGQEECKKKRHPRLRFGFPRLDTTSPRRADPCGATERAPESSGSYFWKRCLSTLRCRESRC